MEQEPMQSPGAIRPWLLIVLIAVAVGAAGYFGWQYLNKTREIPNPSPSSSETLSESMPSDFNFVFGFGANAQNQLDTFKNQFTKDMVMDKDITTKITLTNTEKQQIYQTMVDIDLFSYPGDITPSTLSNGQPIPQIGSPRTSYYFKVQANSQVKEVSWTDIGENSDDTKTAKLRQLSTMIQDIIESKPEFKAIPTPTTFYL